MKTNNCQPSQTVYAPTHINSHKSGGARCNACTRSGCSAGIKTDPRTKARYVDARFECPGQCVILSAKRNEGGY